ncbi:glutamate cyclase domain-containing protein [Neptunicella sp. SCSIO 80796]|uniref:glutamate cyclase domain-containing protein n=1 Tax=Neptunicella plasticusilytica TaxID=3117012 RepID=UPI003A4E10AA
MKNTLSQSDQRLSQQVENLLVERNLRGMQTIQPLLQSGYCARAAQLLLNLDGKVLIGTGFPVNSTFETDGPVGAIALYQALEHLNAEPILVCGNPLFTAVKDHYNAVQLTVGDLDNAKQESLKILAQLQPQAVISIERAGMTANGRFFNMRGEDISDRCACFDYFMSQSQCPSIGIGDGGNEIGMGNIHQRLSHLNIVPSITTCTELVIADVSNWAAYGIILFLQRWTGKPLLEQINPKEIIRFLSNKGSVDGVTRENTMTEDGLCYSEGEALLSELILMANR